VPIPCVLEVTFANRALYEFQDSKEVFPTELDAPCNRNQPDLFLGAFRFHTGDVGATSAKTINNNVHIPDEWKARADAATQRRQRLLSFGPRASGLLVASNEGPLVVDAEDSSVGAALLTQGSYADHEYELARSLIKPDGNVLVVGAHIGAHVVRLAKHCRELIAVEANPRTFSLLEANVRLQNATNVQLLNLAAGEKAGKIQFLQNRDNTGGSKRKPVHDQFYYSYDDPDIIDVECARLDDILPASQGYDLIFMDIEGSEFFALQGMQAILGRSKALSIEFLSHHLRDVAAVSADQISSLITPHFNWMFIPDSNDFVQFTEIGARMRQMYHAGENHDCIYFLKELSSAWLADRRLTDPRAHTQAASTV
jgi:FkbM family methyltransferase